MTRYALQSLFGRWNAENRKKKIMTIINPKYDQVERGIKLMPVHAGIWGGGGWR